MHLQWFRDQGMGQEAADDTGAEQLMDGWPVAILRGDKEYCDRMWRYLLTRFAVNAMTYSTAHWVPGNVPGNEVANLF